MKNKIWHLIWVLAVIAVTVIYTSSFASPNVISFLTRCYFAVPTKTAPDDFDRIKSHVKILKNIEYKSDFEGNKMDIYSPSENPEKSPVIIWLHGGAFVGGDKKDISYFATSLAEKGYVVVAGNYGLAPMVNFPNSPNQVADIYEYLKKSKDFKGDLSRIFLAGDSAGANIAAMFAAAQTSKEYSHKSGINMAVPKEDIKGVLLFCGVYDMEDPARDRKAFIKFILDRCLWAYFGEQDWKEKYAHLGTVKHHVTKEFPPVFITDGNTGSFIKDAHDLEEVLRGKGVIVQSYYAPKSETSTYHEYQFKMHSKHGKIALEKTLEFLNEASYN